MITMDRVSQARLKSVARAHKLDLIVLFGSHAKGRAIAGSSDLDIAVRFVQGPTPKRTGRGRLYADLASVFPSDIEVDLTILNRAGPLLRFEVARSGILLYQHTPTTFAQFKYSASRAYDDNQKFFAARERYMKARYGV
jgi:predicted nucleotidyltransferase